MDMKEIYPRLPTAPLIKDQGQGYRLQKMNAIQSFLEKEVVTREALSKKYFRAARIVDTVLITVTLGGGVGGIGLLSTLVVAPVVIMIEGVALFTGLLSIIDKYSVKKSTSKAEKHKKIKTIEVRSKTKKKNSGRNGEQQLQTDVSKFYKPITETQKTAAREITEGLRPIREGIENPLQAIIFPPTQLLGEALGEEELRSIGEIAKEYLSRPNPDKTYGMYKKEGTSYYR